MKFSKTTRYIVMFTVEAYIAQEGGMDVESYGETVSSIESAVHLLELAQVHDPTTDWIIVGRVQRNIQQKEEE